MRKSVSMGLVAGVLGMGVASAEIKVSDALSLSGFLDMSARSSLPDVGAKTLEAAFDQFELDFKYTFAENLTAQADLNSLGGGAMVLEQAFLTYGMGPLSITTGKFLSSIGFEAAEPTGLYQYSIAKSTPTYGGYQNGAAVSYTVSPMISLYGAVVGGVWDNTDIDLTSPGFEAQIALMPVEGVTAKVTYALTAIEDTAGDYNQSMVNAWASYAAGPLTVAGEFNYLMNWGAADVGGTGYLAMVNYKLSDKLGITGRFSGIKMDGGSSDTEVTVSPGYAISDAWFVLAEVKQELDAKITSFGVESILTF